MRRMSVRASWTWLGIALAWVGGCAPLPLAEAAPRPAAERLSYDAASAQLHFHDASGRLRALRLLEDATSIELEARAPQAWPSFLDGAVIGRDPVGSAHEAVAPRLASRATGLPVTHRASGASLDSPGPGW